MERHALFDDWHRRWATRTCVGLILLGLFLVTSTTSAQDNEAPVCELSEFDARGLITMAIKVIDDGGLKSIRVVDPGGMTLDIQSFSPGYTDSVTVSATQIQALGLSNPVLEVEDVSGNKIACTFLDLASSFTSYVQAAIHNAGNIVLLLQRTSEMNVCAGHWQFDFNGYWPKQAGANHVCGGSLWLETDESITYSTFGFRNESHTTTGFYRWMPGSGTQTGSGLHADQEIRIHYKSEGGAVDVLQTSFQWADPDDDDFIVFAYTVENRSTTPFSETVPGLWLDPNVGGSSENYAGYDAASEILYALNSDSTVYVGLRVLGSSPLSAHAYRPFNDPLMEEALRLGFREIPDESGDYRLVISTGPFPLAAGEKRTVSFGLVIGESFEALKANATAMQQRFEAIGVNTEGGTGQPPVAFGIHPNYPDPFNQTTTIAYDLPRLSNVTLTVYDVLGREVSVLASSTQPAGTHEVTFDATDLPSGIYFYRLTAGDYVETERMAVVK